MSKGNIHAGGDWKQTVQRHFDDLQGIPSKGVFSSPVITSRTENTRQVSYYSNAGLLRKVGQIKSPRPNSGHQAALWWLKPMVVDYLDEYATHREQELPCGHTGFTNTGEWIQCKTCNGRFTKAEVQEA